MQAKELRLDLAMWMLAWDRYSLAAAMTNQLTLEQALAHKGVVTEVHLFSHSVVCSLAA